MLHLVLHKHTPGNTLLIIIVIDKYENIQKKLNKKYLNRDLPVLCDP